LLGPTTKSTLELFIILKKNNGGGGSSHTSFAQSLPHCVSVIIIKNPAAKIKNLFFML
jgi:hypothetical protein